MVSYLGYQSFLKEEASWWTACSLSSGFASSCQLVYSRWVSVEMDASAVRRLDVRHSYYSCTSVTLHLVESFFFFLPLSPHTRTLGLGIAAPGNSLFPI